MNQDIESINDLKIGKRQQYVTDKRYITKDGSVVWGQVSVSLVRDKVGHPLYYLPMIVDITERKKTQEMLETSKNVIEGIINAINVRVFWKDKNLIYLGCNTIFARDAGFETPQDIIGKTDYQMGWRDQAEAYRADDRQVIRSGIPKLNIEEPQTTPDGNTITLLTNKIPLLDSKGEVGGVIGTYLDITQRKKVEAEQKILRDKTEMASRLAAVGERAAGIAHEINNPLTGVIGFSELLLERPGLAADVKEEIRIINDGSQRVRDIIKRMLTFARQVEPQRRNVSINELMENTLELRDYVLKTANIKVVKNYDPDLPWVNADPGQLQQVFLNLIVNAEYAMKKASQQGILTIKTERLDDQIRVSFTDNGTGMSETTLAKLFQPFFTTKNPGEGTGLGLSLSHGIIQEHLGTLWAESVVGHGSTFIIDLPVTLVERPPVIEEPLPEPVQVVKHARILVVDDEPTVRSFISTILTRRGHVVEECDDSRLVIEKLQAKNYDVIMLDLRMPGMSGMALFSAISARWPKLTRHVIFITGDASDLDTREYLATHQISFITKPFDRKTLIEKVNVLLGY